MKKPVMLMILDGYGLRKEKSGNAVYAAKTPNIDALMEKWPNATLGASGLDVGLPDGQMGNSEVGHTNIGAGRIVYQELTRISKAISDGVFVKNEVLNAAVDAMGENSTLHLMGLLSDGGVHSHNTHLYALLNLAKERGVKNVAVHCFMDGRDTDPKSGAGYIDELCAEMEKIGVGVCATVTGRYYAMDRDSRWERVVLGYSAIANGEGEQFGGSAADAVRKSYEEGVTDEFIKPMVMQGYNGVCDGDAMVFFNFRPDRAREMTRAFVDADFNGFEREQKKLAAYVCMTCYDKTMPNCTVAFPPQSLDNTLGEVIEKAGMKQLRIAETEKYAHVTFFFNGGVEAPFKNEDRTLIASPKVATYDLKPEMSAYEVTDKLLEQLDNDYDLIVLNYANCDMVGHTGVFDAAVAAVEAVDTCVGKICDKVLSKGGAVLLTADHGNADEMTNPDGSPMTAHSTNRVPFVAVGCEGVCLREDGILCDLAPTLLELLKIEKPAEMTGKSLFC